MEQAKVDSTAKLIQSLTPSEKRYLKLNVLDLNKGNNAVKLYHFYTSYIPNNDISEFPEYLTKGMNLSYEKSNLRRVILRSLRNYHENLNDTSFSLNTLLDIEILFNRKLYDDALSIIDKMLKITTEMELFVQKLEYLLWYRKLLIRKGDYATLSKRADFLEAEINDCFKKNQNLNDYRCIQSKLLGIISKSGVLISDEATSELKNIIKHSLLSDEKNALSFNAKCHFYEAWGWYYKLTLQPKKSLSISENFITFLEENFEKTIQYPQIYFSALSNYVTRCTSLNKYDQALKGIEKLKSITTIKGLKIDDSLKVTVTAFALERKLTIHTYTHDFKEAIALFEEVKLFIKKNGEATHLTFKNVTRIFTSISYFHLADYKAALTLIREMFDDKSDNQRYDNYLYAHLLQILIHYEMGNFRLIPYLVKAAKHFCKSKKFNEKSIPLFMELISRLTKATTEKEKLKMKAENLAIFKTLNNNENTIFETLSLDLWFAKK